MRRLICVSIVAVVLIYNAPLMMSQVTAPPSSPVTTVPGTLPTLAPGAPQQPAIAVTTVPSPAAPQNPMDQVIWAGAMSLLLRYLMKRGWVLDQGAASRLKTQVGFLVALATAAGIHLVVNGSFFSAEGVGFTVTGFSAHALKDVGFQWFSQQMWYEAIVKKVTV